MKRANTSVSIHIVTFNNEETIRACIESVRTQSYQDRIILVIDNASTDKTSQIVKKLGVQIIENPKNLGYAAAHNIAMRKTQSKYVLTLNPDVVLDKDFLRHMVRSLDRDPRVGSAAGLLYRVERLGDKRITVDGAGLFMRRNRRQGLRWEGRPGSEVPRRSVPIFGPDGAAAFYRRAMLEDIRFNDEYFDEAFFMHKEDVDVCWRAAWRGWRSLFVPAAIGSHIRTFRAGRRENISDALRMIAVRNRYLLMIKNESVSGFVRDVFPILVYDLGVFFFILIKERRSLSAYRDVLQLIPTMTKKRAWIATNRKETGASMGKWFV